MAQLLPNEFVRKFYLSALLANGLSHRRASFALAQAAQESGYLTPSGVAAKTQNLFGITRGSTWRGETYTSLSSGLIFRVYDRYTQSFKDHADLLNRLYPQVASAQTIEAYARNISYSPYIQDSDGREAYEAAVIRLYRDQQPAVKAMRLKFIGGTSLAGILLGVALYLVLAPGRKFKDANDFFKNG